MWCMRACVFLVWVGQASTAPQASSVACLLLLLERNFNPALPTTTTPLLSLLHRHHHHQFNCSLQELTLAAFPGQLAPDDLATLQTALTAGRQKLRSTVLLGTHAVVGAGSPLLLLPKEVVCRVLELAVPRQPCVLRLELPRQMLEEDSDSDSSDSSDSDSDTSDSSSSSDGE